MDLLKETKWKVVKDYLFDNWYPIKDQWVSCFKDLIFNLGETTNNRLESANAKIKSVCSRYGTLLQFFTEMSALLGVLRNERTHQQLMGLSRLPTEIESFDEDLLAYASLKISVGHRHFPTHS